MEFKEAEERFYELKGRLDAGAISQEEFKAQVEGLKVQDSQGRYWMIGVQSGKWYFYDGTRWVRAEPPGEAGEVPPSEETPRGPVASVPQQPPKPLLSIKPPPGRRGISGALLALIPLGLILACCLSVVAVGAADYLISSHPVSSALSDLLGSQIGFITTPTPTPRLEESPTPTMTATPSAEELIALGDQLALQGQLEEAIAQYQMATALDPQNALAHLKLGKTYLALGRCEEAIPEFEQALAIDPHLAKAQEGLRECTGPPPPRVTFASYIKADLGLSILYPDTWVLSEEENQTIFAESEEALEHLAGSVFIFASWPLETEMTNTQALEERIATLPSDTQLGEMEPAYISGQEWASVHGEMSGEAVPSPSRVYMAATVWHSRLYVLSALAPTDTWKDAAWPIFQAMLKTIEIQEVVAEAPSTPTPTLTPTAIPTETPSPTTTPTSTPTPTATPPTQPTLSGRLAFTVYEGGGYETYVANMDGSGLQKIWSRMYQPDFDPSGEWLAVNGELSGHLDLQIIEITLDNTAGQHRKVSRHYEDSWPSWSPDGSRIVFVFNKEKQPVKILTDLNKATEGDPLKGPDGKNIRGTRYPVWTGDNRIAFTTCDYWGVGSNCGIYTISEKGGDATRISDDSQDRATDGFGNQVLYISPADGDWEIYKVASTGGSPVRLTDNSAQDGLATWSPDGQHIAFLTDRTGSWEIWVMNADGSNPRTLFTLLPGVPGDEWPEERISWGR